MGDATQLPLGVSRVIRLRGTLPRRPRTDGVGTTARRPGQPGREGARIEYPRLTSRWAGMSKGPGNRVLCLGGQSNGWPAAEVGGGVVAGAARPPAVVRGGLAGGPASAGLDSSSRTQSSTLRTRLRRRSETRPAIGSVHAAGSPRPGASPATEYSCTHAWVRLAYSTTATGWLQGPLRDKKRDRRADDGERD
jgi:hypothetical protein